MPIMLAEIPILETERLYLRGFTAGDLDLLHRLYSNAEVMSFISVDGRPYTRERTEERLAAAIYRWTQHGIPMWAVFRKADQEFVGRCGFQIYEATKEIELAYTLLPQAWGNGYATEASLACLDHVFTVLNWDRVVSRTRPTNTRSLHVMEKVGFQIEKVGEDIGGAAVFEFLTREMWKKQ
ncbi:MAG TPA: GNAT family N-acetyltransferase [Gemmataceae bacterium]|jgi:RimJ/RimL family protein N-acetyltransferase|nr:GNAT family N-acetyltransferase [Gemmataceae bacterium]